MVAPSRPELDLLIACARTRLDSEASHRIRALLRQDLDWQALLRAGRQQGVRPLLYWNLKATDPDAVPKNVWNSLSEYFRLRTRRNLLLTGELLKTLKHLDTEGIPAVPFKGPALAMSIYGDVKLRSFWDLDILVHARDVLKARELLTAQGYRPLVPLGSAREAAAYLKSHWELKSIRDEDGAVIDLHWRFTARYFSFPFDAERLWERLEWVSLQGQKVLSLSPEDLLLILCVHGATHSWERLQWICDVAELVRAHPTLDWGRIVDQARKLGGARMLLLGLLLARDVLGARLPDEVVRIVQSDRRIEAIATRVREHMWRAGHPGVPESALFHLSVRERPLDKLRYCVRFALTPTARDWALLRVPAPLAIVYYLLRPIRLLKRYALSRLPVRKHGNSQ